MLLSLSPYHGADALEYAKRTRDVDMSWHYRWFLDGLAERRTGPLRILDLGCGSGRDSRYFRSIGAEVEAIDESPDMVAITRQEAGVPARQMRAQDLEEPPRFDGVWASASLLHVPEVELLDVFHRIAQALVPGGRLFASFKWGSGERSVGASRFTYMTPTRLASLAAHCPPLRLKSTVCARDTRPEFPEQIWVCGLFEKRGPEECR